MKKLLIILAAVTSMNSFASECVVSKINFTRTIDLAGENPIQLVETELQKKGFIIDGSDVNGLSISIGYYRVQSNNPRSGTPSILEFGKAFGHLITAGVFTKGVESTITIRDSQKELVSYTSKRMNAYKDIEAMTLAALDKVSDCN